jgi:hypothetical protein
VGQLIVTEFVTLDGVAQAPGGPDEDRDGGFRHGGWQAPLLDQQAGGRSPVGDTVAESCWPRSVLDRYKLGAANAAVDRLVSDALAVAFLLDQHSAVTVLVGAAKNDSFRVASHA